MIARFKGQRISQVEMDSVANFIDKFLLSFSLLNDLYSFHKEFEEHSASGNINTICNVIALLMSGYGYDEEEATSIVEQEILSIETQALEEFHAWHSSSLEKSRNLVGYAFTVLGFIGGMNYWMSHSARYFRTDLTTSAQDRAKLIRSSPSSLRGLKDYPAPRAKDSHATSILGLCSAISGPLIGLNGIPTNSVNAVSHVSVTGGDCRGTEIDITQIIRKADTGNVCYEIYNRFYHC